MKHGQWKPHQILPSGNKLQVRRQIQSEWSGSGEVGEGKKQVPNLLLNTDFHVQWLKLQSMIDGKVQEGLR